MPAVDGVHVALAAVALWLGIVSLVVVPDLRRAGRRSDLEFLDRVGPPFSAPLGPSPLPPSVEVPACRCVCSPPPAVECFRPWWWVFLWPGLGLAVVAAFAVGVCLGRGSRPSAPARRGVIGKPLSLQYNG